MAQTRSLGGLLGLTLAAALLTGGAPPAAAEVRSIEALGAVPLNANSPPAVPPRDAALRRALHGAVWRVALAELPGFDPSDEAAQAALKGALGKEPLDYATRFRVVEDRGERPALFSEDPGVETEYVVLVEVHVDTDRVRERLSAAGLLAPPSGDARRYRVRVVLEEVGSYGAYQAVRTLLEEMGARSAVPVEMERGRAVLEVDGTRSPDALIAALVRAAPPNLSVVPLGVDDEGVHLRARFLGGAASTDPGTRRDSRAFDTPEANRY
jgi:hypothetical protein